MTLPSGPSALAPGASRSGAYVGEADYGAEGFASRNSGVLRTRLELRSPFIRAPAGVIWG